MIKALARHANLLDAGSLERAEEDVGNELGHSGGGEVDVVALAGRVNVSICASKKSTKTSTFVLEKQVNVAFT